MSVLSSRPAWSTQQVPGQPARWLSRHHKVLQPELHPQNPQKQTPTGGPLTSTQMLWHVHPHAYTPTREMQIYTTKRQCGHGLAAQVLVEAQRTAVHPRTHVGKENQATVVDPCNPGTREAKAGRPLHLAHWPASRAHLASSRSKKERKKKWAALEE